MEIVTIPCLFDNYGYLIICPKTGQAAVVDPAEAYPVLSEVDRCGVRLVAVLCTHHHADHIGGLEELLGERPELAVYASAGDQRRIPGMNRPLADGANVTVGSLDGQVLSTPGHTAGSVCYRFGRNLFTGDTLFGAGCGRLFEGSPSQMYHSLNRTIKALPPETNVYFGHEYTVQDLKFAEFIEPENLEVERRLADAESRRRSGQPTTPSTLALELATNPFLRCEEQGIIRSLSEKIVDQNHDPVLVFAALRRLKDSF